jgi:hypothetical protein
MTARHELHTRHVAPNVADVVTPVARHVPDIARIDGDFARFDADLSRSAPPKWPAHVA